MIYSLYYVSNPSPLLFLSLQMICSSFNSSSSDSDSSFTQLTLYLSITFRSLLFIFFQFNSYCFSIFLFKHSTITLLFSIFVYQSFPFPQNFDQTPCSPFKTRISSSFIAAFSFIRSFSYYNVQASFALLSLISQWVETYFQKEQLSVSWTFISSFSWDRSIGRGFGVFQSKQEEIWPIRQDFNSDAFSCCFATTPRYSFLNW
ncbi:hypothetical protein FGO68_gene9989 [Halteria grandinella]|uniref:Uncharacterized protein n=1 Tax=Halteria grandinella TaxID=5974 RepID=A0A8J8T094_HALGN|nr:hypothetical protein FGO68_gene9989 [Halteria grandinella]